MKDTKNKRLSEAELLTKFTHIVEGTLRFDEVANKQKVTIYTRGIDGSLDGGQREIATSDLHQCFWSVEVKAEMDRIKRNQKAQAKRALRTAQAIPDAVV